MHESPWGRQDNAGCVGRIDWYNRVSIVNRNRILAKVEFDPINHIPQHDLDFRGILLLGQVAPWASSIMRIIECYPDGRERPRFPTVPAKETPRRRLARNL